MCKIQNYQYFFWLDKNLPVYAVSVDLQTLLRAYFINFYNREFPNKKNYKPNQSSNKRKRTVVDIQSLHPNLEGIYLFCIDVIHPKAFYSITCKLSFVEDCMRSDIFLGESDSSSIVVEAAHDLKFSNRVFPTSSDMTLRHWGNIELLEGHYILLSLVHVMASPLARLHEMRHSQLDKIDLISLVEVMGCEQSSQDQVGVPNRAPTIHPVKEQPNIDLNQTQMAISQHGYHIAQLQNLIKKAFDDLRSRDPMGKRLYLNQILNFILAWLPKAMNKGMTLFDAEKIVRQDLERACKAYPIAQVEQITTSIVAKGTAPYPDLFADVKNKTQQTFTDRIKELCHRSKEVSYQFNKQMQLILEKDGGYKFITGYKYTGSKAYLRIMTKVLDPFLSEKEQSRQVYTDLNHYYYLPVFEYFNTIIDKNIKNLKIELYDWIRCKCSFKNIHDLEKAYIRLQNIHGGNIFRVKNRINQNTRDLLINLKFKTEYTQIQLALQYDDQSYEFQHKLYELTREKLGVAYSCFTFMLNDSGDAHGSFSGVMTSLGYLKKTLLREKVEPNFERLTYEDAEILHEDVKGLLGKWGVASLKTGYADASNQKSLLTRDLYGPDTEYMLIIKKRQQHDAVFNWLNWMD